MMKNEADPNAAGGVVTTAEYKTTFLDSGTVTEDITFTMLTDNSMTSEWIDGDEKVVSTVLADGTYSEQRFPVE